MQFRSVSIDTTKFAGAFWISKKLHQFFINIQNVRGNVVVSMIHDNEPNYMYFDWIRYENWRITQFNFGLVSRSTFVRKEISPYLKLSMFNHISTSFGSVCVTKKIPGASLNFGTRVFCIYFFFFALNTDSKTGKKSSHQE